jgi:hypothetical protein
VEKIQWTDAMRELMRVLSKRGAAKGGHARAAAMTKAERKASARKAAKARWAKKSNRTRAPRPSFGLVTRPRRRRQ